VVVDEGRRGVGVPDGEDVVLAGGQLDRGDRGAAGRGGPATEGVAGGAQGAVAAGQADRLAAEAVDRGRRAAALGALAVNREVVVVDEGRRGVGVPDGEDVVLAGGQLDRGDRGAAGRGGPATEGVAGGAKGAVAAGQADRLV